MSDLESTLSAHGHGVSSDEFDECDDALSDTENEEGGRAHRDNSPPVNPDRWATTRQAQSLKMLEFFHGNVEVKKKAQYLLVEILGLCKLIMGSPNQVSWHAERNHVNPSTGSVYKRVADPFDGMYSSIGSAAAWACFALQQAFYEYNHHRFECGSESAASEWDIRTLHSVLVHYKKERFQSDVAGKKERLHTSAGSSAFRGAQQAIDGETEAQRRLRVDNLGDDADLIKKAKFFRLAYQLRFDGEDDVFCESIVMLKPPAVITFRGQGASKTGTFMKKQAEFADKTRKAVQQKAGPVSRPASMPGIGPRGSSTSNRSTVVVKPSTVVRQVQKEAKRDAARAKEHEERLRVQQAEDAARVSGSFEQDFFVESAYSLAARRATIRHAAESVASAACRNVVKGLIGKNVAELTGGMSAEAFHEIEKRQWHERMDSIRARVVIDDETHEKFGEECKHKLAALSEDDRLFYTRSREPTIDLRRLALENRTTNMYERASVSNPVCRKRGDRKKFIIRSKLKQPPTFEDYALAFKFESAQKAREFLDDVERRRTTVKPGSKVGYGHPSLDLHRIASLFVHLTVDGVVSGLKCKMTQDMVDYNKQKHELMQRLRTKKSYERMPRKYADKNGIKDYDGYQARLRQNQEDRETAEEKQRERHIVQKRNRELKAQKKQDAEKRRVAMKRAKDIALSERDRKREQKRATRVQRSNDKINKKLKSRKLANIAAMIRDERRFCRLIEKGPPKTNLPVYIQIRTCDLTTGAPIGFAIRTVWKANAYMEQEQKRVEFNRYLRELAETRSYGDTNANADADAEEEGEGEMAGEQSKKQKTHHGPPEYKRFGLKLHGHSQKIYTGRMLPEKNEFHDESNSEKCIAMHELAQQMNREEAAGNIPVFTFGVNPKHVAVEECFVEPVLERINHPRRCKRPAYKLVDYRIHSSGSPEAEHARQRLSIAQYPNDVFMNVSGEFLPLVGD